MTGTREQPMWIPARWRWSACAIAIVVGAMLLWQPQNVGVVRCALVALLVIAVVSTVAATPRRGRLPLAIALGAIAALALVPWSRPRGSDYVAAMERYAGTPYVWGGENGRGIDCSGLIRAGLIDAAARRGRVATALDLWWHDASARELLDGYGGRCAVVARARRIADLPADALRPGDFVVTASGVHCLAFVGGGKWISADPASQHVLIEDAATTSNPYFDTSIALMRWSLLADDVSDR